MSPARKEPVPLMPHRRLLLIATACSLMAMPTVASAHPVKRDFGATYPHASRLCAKAEAGTLPRRVASSAGQITAACDALHAAFTPAQTSLNDTAAGLRSQAATAIAGARAACRQARAAHDRAACRAAVEQARVALRGLRTQLKTAVTTYRSAVQDARRSFWTAIRALRGGKTITPDTGAGAGAAPSLPGDGALSAL